MSFTVREVSAMLGLTAAQIRGFASKGFLTPERGERGELRFGFQDLIILRTAGELSSARIPQRKVRRVLQALREQLPEGRSLAGIRISADGDRVVVREGGAMWNPESGQSLFDFAVSDLAIDAAPFVLHDHTASAEEWYQLGCQWELTDGERAAEAYRKAIDLEPGHADAHVNLGRLMHEQRAFARAVEHYQAALDADPEHDTAAFNLGVALEDLGRRSDAARAYEAVLAIDPDNADAHYNLAGILEKRGDKSGALRHLTACRRLTR